jgi:hypothetical protein
MLPILKTYVLPTVLSLAALAAAYGIGLLLNKAHVALGQLADKLEVEKRGHLQVMLLRATDALTKCAADAVMQIETKIRPTILGAAVGGKLDESQAKALLEQAKALAWEQAKNCYGGVLLSVGENIASSMGPPVLSTLVESAASRLAGTSRALGTAPLPQPSPAVALVPPAPAQA